MAKIDDIAEDVAAMKARMDARDVQFAELKEDMREMKGDVKSLLERINKAHGGLITMLAVGGAVSAVISWVVSKLAAVKA